MRKTTVPKEIVVLVAREQDGIPAHKAICANPDCSSFATDPHHWLFKRSSGVSRTQQSVPSQVLNNPINIVLLCRTCHDKFGQTPRMVRICYHHKIALGYDIPAWIDGLIKTRVIRVRPDLGALNWQDENEKN